MYVNYQRKVPWISRDTGELLVVYGLIWCTDNKYVHPTANSYWMIPGTVSPLDN